MKLRKQYTPGAYDKCIACQFRGNGCDGPRTTSMPIERWCMLMRRLKEAGGYTNEEITESTGISSKTVQKIMAGSVETDLRASTMSAIEGFLFGTSGTYPCPMELIPDQEELAVLRKELALSLEKIAAMERLIKEQEEDRRRLRAIIDRKEVDISRKDARIAQLMDKILGE